MNTSSNPSRTGALPHIDTLYAMAQVLTLDAEKAAALLQQTYNRALETAGHQTVVLEDKQHLMQLLIRIHHEQTSAIVSPEDPKSISEQQTTPGNSVKQRLLNQFFRDAAPVAFATLDDPDRALLALCDIDKMSCADAAHILGDASEATCARLEEARKSFEEAVIRNAPPAEAQLLEQLGASEWRSNALHKAVHSEFVAAPPTLEPRIKSALTAAYPLIRDHQNRTASVPKQTSGNVKPRKSRLSRGLSTILLILVAGMVGYVGSALLAGSTEVDLIALSVKKAARVETILPTSDPKEAEQFVKSQMDWRLKLPVIQEGMLTGVGISEIASDVRVPVFLYSDDEAGASQRIAMYAYTYALLDRFSDRITLKRDILTAISSDDHFDVHDLGEKEKAVVWRNSNDIFIAVTAGDARALRERIMVD